VRDRAHAGRRAASADPALPEVAKLKPHKRTRLPRCEGFLRGFFRGSTTCPPKAAASDFAILVLSGCSPTSRKALNADTPAQIWYQMTLGAAALPFSIGMSIPLQRDVSASSSNLGEIVDGI
jgi:hypothetical protein